MRVVTSLLLVAVSQASIELETTSGCGKNLTAAHYFQKQIEHFNAYRDVL